MGYSDWPEAIHHYLRAGLQRQAARLIAKYGEEVVAEGRLGLVDEWLQQLPEDTIKQNARLSLLYGETCGIRGNWDRSLEALERARAYFSRKGDRRLEALACLKLSSVYSNYGEPHRAIEVAEEGVALAPTDAVATRLRLEGNIAITRTWLTESLEAVAAECQRIGEEASARGLEHFAAIGHHNAGCALARLGRFESALRHFNLAATTWSDSPTSPFADNAELVAVLLALGRIDRARSVAADAVHRTAPWPRPHADALAGHANVLMADGRFPDAVIALEAARADAPFLGGLHSVVNSRLIEALFLARRYAEIPPLALEMVARAPDPRFAAEAVAARAIGQHVAGNCDGGCVQLAGELDAAKQHGDLWAACTGSVKIGVLALEHAPVGTRTSSWTGVAEAKSLGLWPSLRYWLRLYGPHARSALKVPDGARLLAALAMFDPDGWRGPVVTTLAKAKGNDRSILLEAVSRIANRDTLDSLSSMAGNDVLAVRRQLRFLQAPRLFLRTLGGVAFHRGNWDGPPIPIEKKRVRMLLAVLAAHFGSALSRDVAIDILWPEADPNSAVNSLNQTVFQLRRYIDPAYRAGESPEYVTSTSEQVGLSPDLVHTDLSELRRLPARLATADWHDRQSLASRCVKLVRGEFLADLRYEDWANRQQLSVHGEIRESLLPIALAPITSFEVDVAAQAAAALLNLDPFDEAAILALADCLSQSGRRAAARQVVVDFLRRMQSDLDLDPSTDFRAAASQYGLSISH